MPNSIFTAGIAESPLALHAVFADTNIGWRYPTVRRTDERESEITEMNKSVPIFCSR